MTTHPAFVISIQSQVVFGHVGNSAAVFPMQAAGLEVAPIPTVIFSNTPHYPSLRGRPLPKDFFADLLLGAQERDLPARADYIVTGYIGSVDVAELTADFIADAKAQNPALTYICDPVMGDAGPGLYVPETIATVMRDQLLPLADIITPNPFELSYLTGQTIETLADLRQAADRLELAENAQLITTGCALKDTPKGMIESIIVGQGKPSRHPTRLLPIALPGTGDLFVGLVTAALGRSIDLPNAVEFAQELTAYALEHAKHLGASEVVLNAPKFRAALVSLRDDTGT